MRAELVAIPELQQIGVGLETAAGSLVTKFAVADEAPGQVPFENAAVGFEREFVFAEGVALQVGTLALVVDTITGAVNAVGRTVARLAGTKPVAVDGFERVVVQQVSSAAIAVG